MRPVLDIRTAKVEVELTNRCNLRCGMCPMDRMSRPQGDMPWWLVEKAAAELAEAGARVSWLHELGEPLLYPRLADAIQLFPGCSISTNAMLLDEDRGRELLATSLRRIRLCIDTVDPEAYPRLRRGGSFSRVVDNIRTFLDLSKGRSIQVEIQHLISLATSSETARDLQDFFALDSYPQARVIEKTCEGLDTARATEFHEAYHGCFQGYPFRYFVVLSDGTVTHCCYDYDGAQAIGDLKTSTVREILAGDVPRRLMAAFQERDFTTLPRCGECMRAATGSGAVTSRVMQIGHRLDRLLPVKRIARKIINR